MNLSIAERRDIANQAATDPAFRALLQTQPHEAVGKVIGRPLDGACMVDVIDEGEEWHFVLVAPDAIELDLPDPVDPRSAVENSAYALLRDNPPLREEMQRDPIAFARAWLDVELQDQSVLLHAEAPATLVVVVPNLGHREELDDEAMDLIAAGNDVNAGGLKTGSNVPPATVDPRH